MVDVQFEARHAAAQIPQYQTAGAAGADLHSVEFYRIEPGQVQLVRLGFAVSIPEGYEIQVRSRSGLALKKRVLVLNSPGTVDSDYRGEMMVILANMGTEPFLVEQGDRVAQMVVNKVETAKFSVVEKLDETVRGEGGFGSSGVKS